MAAKGKEVTVQNVSTRASLVRDLKRLGVRPGDLLAVKASLKSIGHVEGGADALREALLEALGPSGTVVALSFVNVYPLPLNGEDRRKVSSPSSPSYAGALANAFLRHPDVCRSTHPIQKFTAIGARARELMEAHTPESYAYDVLRVLAEEGGRALKIGSDEKTVGVGTTHVAIGILGLRQRRPRCGVSYQDRTGGIATFERDWAGACARGFINFMPHYRRAGAILGEGRIGQAASKITDMRRTLEVEVEMLRKDPSFFMCKDPACPDCRLSWEFSEGDFLPVLFRNVLRRRRKAVENAIRLRFNRNFLPPAGAPPVSWEGSETERRSAWA